jgi:hypothetical protein
MKANQVPLVNTVPESLDELVGRRFSFYPPIVNVEHNEWTFVRGTWSEVLVRNSKMGVEVWIPRAYLGELSKVDEPVMIVGLRRELEFKGGAVWPYMRRVLDMPRPPRVQPSGEAPVKGEPRPDLKRDGGAELRVGRLILTALLVAVALTLLVAVLLRRETSGGSIEYKGVVQAELGLSATDDYFAVVRKLGKPASDRWKEPAAERQYRALSYPHLKLTVILMGADRESALYIGAKDDEWRTVHSVELPGGQKTDSMLRALPRF